MKYTSKYVKEKMEEYKIDYTLDEEVINSTMPIKMHCNKCGTNFVKAPYILLMNKKHCCSGCEGNRRFKKGKNSFFKRLEKSNYAKLIGEYTGYYNTVTLQCLKNQNHIWNILACNVGEKGCPFCANKMTCKGDNTLGDLYPELLVYFKNKEEAFTITPKSAKKIHLVCPDCNTEKELEARELVEYGFNCLVCSDKVSVPNKFLRRFLLQAKEKNLVDEINFEWNKVKGSQYRFDASFKKNETIYCIEMQGIQHKNGWNGIKDTKESIQKRDRIKKELAQKMNWVHIEIECDRTDFNYIYNNFISNYILKELFDFKEFNWKYIKNNLDKNIKKEICEDFDKDLSQNIKSLSKKYGISGDTIRKYLKSGEYFGWCDFEDNKYRTKWGRSNVIQSQEIRRIIILKDNHVIEYGSGLREIIEYFKKINGNKSLDVNKFMETKEVYMGYYILHEKDLTTFQLKELEQFQYEKQEKHKQQRKLELAKKHK